VFALVALVAGAAVPAAIVWPASAVSGLTYVRAGSPDTGTEPFKFAQAFCPTNTHVLGGGVEITDGANLVHVSSMLPIAGDGARDSFYATAMLDSQVPPTRSWRMSAWAICASGVSGWEIVQSFVAAEPGATFLSVTALCPAGKKVVGAGGRISGGQRFVVDSVDPFGDLSGVSVEGAGDERAPDPALSWGVGAYAVCVNPPAGLRLVSATTGFSPDNKTKSVTCPSGTKLHGTGGGLTGAFGQAHVYRLAPHSSARTVRADIDARQDFNGSSNSWQAYVYAICAR
jgi:hypothetical protein